MPFAPSPTDGSLPTDLVLLAAERAVTVIREEHHQDVLSGRTGRAVVELRPCLITSGKHAGQDGLEVVLDGRRVGELTRLMAQRYRPVVDHLTARGYRAGCEAFLQEDARGTQVEFRLPAGPTTAGLPSARYPALAPTVRHRRPDPFRPGPTTVAAHVVPRQRPPAPTTAIPHATPQPPTPIPPAPGRGRSRHAPWVVGAAIGVLLLASALGNAARDDQPAAGLPQPTAAADAAPATSSPALPAAPVTSSTPADESVNAPVITTAPRSAAQARPPAATPKPVTRAPAATSKPAPRTVQPAPKPAPAAKPEPKPSGCDPNYSGCVPIAFDVDCAGGSGDGPEYVSGPVRVLGTDKYRLDNDKDGLGCE